jgi:hypothetical protein
MFLWNRENKMSLRPNDVGLILTGEVSKSKVHFSGCFFTFYMTLAGQYSKHSKFHGKLAFMNRNLVLTKRRLGSSGSALSVSTSQSEKRCHVQGIVGTLTEDHYCFPGKLP